MSLISAATFVAMVGDIARFAEIAYRRLVRHLQPKKKGAGATPGRAS